MRNKYTAEQRAELTEEVRATGARVSEVAKRMGISSSAAYLWMKAVVPAPGAPVFVRVVPWRVPTLRVDVGRAALIVEKGFDAELLRQIVAALGGSR